MSIHSSFSSSSTISTTRSFTYDVFLSFRGVDTRRHFIPHLYSSLVQAGIHTFKDDNELHRGEEITHELLNAIEESRISIVVFSKNYASSSWCLEELVKIIDCRKTRGQCVVPVFYDVSPSEVRRQTGSYSKAFEKHQVRFLSEYVEEWRTALTQAANLSGWDLQDRHESRLISQIVKDVLSQVKPKQLFIAKYSVGLDSRCSEVSLLLRCGSLGVHVIGIYGMGGKGKTAIAKALYNSTLHLFDSSCFLANVREVSDQPNGLVYLQEQLLSELLERKNVKICNVHRGMRMIKERLGGKSVLIVIDDMDKLNQVNSLAGDRNWFGPGSRIIITTRDEHLLNLIRADDRYEAKELNPEESLKLFSWHSFNQSSPPQDYATLSNQIVAYSGGLALALEVLGSYLFGRTIVEWKSAIRKLEKVPHKDIQEKLVISYDGLTDNQEKAIFLDIACFFNGMDKDYVTAILDGCGFNADIGISVLRDRCLLTISKKNELRMHDLLRDMGREIIRRQFPEEPGKHSRLWFYEEVANVLEGNTGTEAIEGFTLVPPIEEEIHLSTENFKRMHNLRLLHIDNVHLHGSFKNLSKRIRWICWQNCPLNYLPSELHLGNLVALDMQHNNIRSTIWQGILLMRHLKILNLSHSKCLISTPDFTRVPKLEILILKSCTSLLRIHPSIGCLSKLLFLNLKGCNKITVIPSEICSLKALGYLNLSGCSNLEGLPENLGNIEFLRELSADETAINQLPSSLGSLKHLTSLSLRGCNRISVTECCVSFFTSWVLRQNVDTLSFLPPSISGLTGLRRLILRDCNLCDEDIPFDVGSLSSLQVLDLAGNSICSLPASFTQLANLESLCLDDWTILQSFPELPPNLENLEVEHLSTVSGELGESNWRERLNGSNFSTNYDLKGRPLSQSLSRIHSYRKLPFCSVSAVTSASLSTTDVM